MSIRTILGVWLASITLAHAAPKAPKPRWPVPNPTFEDPSFSPNTNLRQISGIYGPRLKWGDNRYDHHEGFDFYAQFDPAIPDGHHVVTAILPGVVTEVIEPRDPERVETGRKVVVTHEVPWSAYGGPREWGPVKSGYLHLTRIDVKEGQRLEAGDPIGIAGESGYTTTVHLHLNLYHNTGGRDVAVNPARLFTPKAFPGAVMPLDKRLVEVEWLELNKAQRTATARVFLPYNAYTLDGFVFEVGGDTSRAISFEYVSAEQRDRRDTGDQDLFPHLRLFPLRYNGGGAIDRVQPSRVDGDWPLARYPVAGGKGVRLGFDLRAYDVDPEEKKFTLIVHGVLGERVKVRAPGFEHVIE